METGTDPVGAVVTPERDGKVESASMVGRPVDDPLVAIATAYPALTVALATGALVVLRLLAVTRNNVDVALGVLQSAGVTDEAIGSALSLLPYAAPGFALVFLDISTSYYRVGRRALVTMYAFLATAVMSAVLTPVIVLLGFAVLFGVLAIVRRVRASGGTPPLRRPEHPMAYVLAIVGYPLLLNAITFANPWLPPEVITSRDQAVVGYVTSSDSTWTEVLTYQPRVIHVYKTPEITSRETCELDPGLWFLPGPRFLARVTGQQPVMPKCPVS